MNNYNVYRPHCETVDEIEAKAVIEVDGLLKFTNEKNEVIAIFKNWDGYELLYSEEDEEDEELIELTGNSAAAKRLNSYMKRMGV